MSEEGVDNSDVEKVRSVESKLSVVTLENVEFSVISISYINKTTFIFLVSLCQLGLLYKT